MLGDRGVITVPYLQGCQRFPRRGSTIFPSGTPRAPNAGTSAGVTTVASVPTAPGSPGSPLWDPTAVPAATVIVVRDGAAGVEVLMLKRDSTLSFVGGHWVFPGGRIDAADRRVADGADDDDLETAARRAAVREAAEEAGIVIAADSLRRWSHWTPPPESPKRYSTAFFVAP